MINPFEAAEDTTTLVPEKGEGECIMEDGPTTWTCQATGESLHLSVHYKFDVPIGNKIFMSGVMMSGKSASVPLQPIDVKTVKNPVHASVHSIVAGRGPVEHRLQIWVHAPKEEKKETTDNEEASDKSSEEENKDDESTEKSSGDGDGGGHSDGDSASAGDGDGAGTIQENTLRELNLKKRRLGEDPTTVV